jgi:hypothetical protein
VELRGLEPLTPCLQIAVSTWSAAADLGSVVLPSTRQVPRVTGINGTLMARPASLGRGYAAAGDNPGPLADRRRPAYAVDMGALRRLAQNLGLVYRDDGTWRPAGGRMPPTTTPESPAGSRTGALRRLARNLGLVYRDDGT